MPSLWRRQAGALATSASLVLRQRSEGLVALELGAAVPERPLVATHAARLVLAMLDNFLTIGRALSLERSCGGCRGEGRRVACPALAAWRGTFPAAPTFATVPVAAHGIQRRRAVRIYGELMSGFKSLVLAQTSCNHFCP